MSKEELDSIMDQLDKAAPSSPLWVALFPLFPAIIGGICVFLGGMFSRILLYVTFGWTSLVTIIWTVWCIRKMSQVPNLVLMLRSIQIANASSQKVINDTVTEDSNYDIEHILVLWKFQSLL